MHISSLVRSKLFYELCTILYPRPPPLQNQPSMAVCNSIGILAACGYVVNRVLRISVFLPKVAIYMILITLYTFTFLADFDTFSRLRRYIKKKIK